MTKEEMAMRLRDAAWKPKTTGGNASIAARDRRILLRVVDALRAAYARTAGGAAPPDASGREWAGTSEDGGHLPHSAPSGGGRE